MTIRFLFAVLAVIGAAGIVRAQPLAKSKEPSPAEKKSSSIDQRLAEMEQRVAGLIKELHGLRDELAKGTEKAATGNEVKVYHLKHADAAKTVGVLQGLLQGKDGQQMKIAADARTNSVILAGRPDLHELVEAIIERLDQGTPSKKTDKTPEKSKVADSKKPEEKKATEKSWPERLKQLETELGLLKERAAWAERMVQKGFLSKEAWQLDLKSAMQAAELLKKAQEEYRRYTEKKPQGGEKEKKSDSGASKK